MYYQIQGKRLTGLGQGGYMDSSNHGLYSKRRANRNDLPNFDVGIKL
jgi:hypothetical protein